MDQRRPSSFEVSGATLDNAGSAHTTQQGKIEGDEGFLVKPFDCMEGDRDSPASRAYSKVLDIISPTDSPTNMNIRAGAFGRNTKDSRRPWPKPDKQQTGSKCKRATNTRTLPELPAHQQDDKPLQRWLHESPAQGPYHGIADVEEDPYQARSTEGNNTEQHRS